MGIVEVGGGNRVAGPDMPGVINVRQASRLEFLKKNLGREDLRDWYENMQRTRDFTDYDYDLIYLVGPRVFNMSLGRKLLHLPDGTSRNILKDTEEGGEGLFKSPQLRREIKQELAKVIRNSDVHILDTGMSQREWVSRIVDGQFDFMLKSGVEAQGGFREGVSGELRHESFKGERRAVIVDVEKAYKSGRGGIHPHMSFAVDSQAAMSPDYFATYHTHYGVDAKYPSFTDVDNLVSEGEKTFIICVKDHDESYRVHEWVPKAGVDLDGELDRLRPRAYRGDLPGPDKMKMFMDKFCDHEEYVLKKGEAGGMVFTPRPMVNVLRPWKTGRLLHLEEPVLRDWHDNVMKGLDLEANPLELRYMLGGKSVTYTVSPKSIKLPDGSVREIRSGVFRESDGLKRLFFPDGSVNVVGGDGSENTGRSVEQFVTEDLLRRMGEADAPLVGLDRTSREFVSELVREQFRYLREYGVERHGGFAEGVSGLVHTGHDAVHTITMPLDRAKRNGEGAYTPLMVGGLHSGEESGKPLFAEYHSHQGPDNIYPSIGDLLILKRTREESMLVCAIQDDSRIKVVEWMFRQGVDVRKRLEAAEKINGNGMFNWLRGRDLRRFINSMMERREYTLGERDGKMKLVEED